MRTEKKKLLSILLAAITVLTSVFTSFTVQAASWPSFNSSKPIKVYTISTGNNTTAYSNSDLKTKIGTIYASDELFVQSIGQNSAGKWYCKLTYPTSKGRKTAWIPLSVITSATSPGEKGTASVGITTYRRASSSNKAGSISKGDIVYKLAESGSYVQVLYNIGSTSNPSGWRMAWVKKTDFTKSVKVSQGSQNTNSSDIAGMTDVTAYFAGKTVTLQSVQNGKYMCADKDYSNTPIFCNRNSASTWETFTVSSLTSDGWVGLKALSNNKYLSASNDITDTPVRACADNLLSWECFRIYLKGNDFYIKAQVNNKWLCVRVDKENAPVQSYASAPSTWERFNIRFNGQEQYVSATEIIKTAIENSIGANTNAYKALLDINTKYASQLTSSNEKGTVVFMFEGVGNNSSTSKRTNAMCVLVRNGDIIYVNRNSSTIPDYPFNPAKNEGTAMPTIRSGIYNFTTVNHRGKYAALNVTNASVVRFKNKNSFSNSTSTAINVHRRDSDNIAASNANWVNSAGCLLIGKSGKSNTSEYAHFIQALGIVSGNARGDAKKSNNVSGKIVVDRTYAYSYLSGVGYSDKAISTIR